MLGQYRKDAPSHGLTYHHDFQTTAILQHLKVESVDSAYRDKCRWSTSRISRHIACEYMSTTVVCKVRSNFWTHSIIVRFREAVRASEIPIFFFTGTIYLVWHPAIRRGQWCNTTNGRYERRTGVDTETQLSQAIEQNTRFPSTTHMTRRRAFYLCKRGYSQWTRNTMLQMILLTCSLRKIMAWCIRDTRILTHRLVFCNKKQQVECKNIWDDRARRQFVVSMLFQAVDCMNVLVLQLPQVNKPTPEQE